MIFSEQKQRSNKSFQAVPIPSSEKIGRKGIERIDFLLILIEAIEINGVFELINTSKDLGLDKQFSDHVQLWKTRVHNPLRKTSRRGVLTGLEVSALIKLIAVTANRIYPTLRKLLSEKEPEFIRNDRWNELSSRFNDLIIERMNLKRSSIQKILRKESNNSFLRELVFILAISSGVNGADRLTKNILNLK